MAAHELLEFSRIFFFIIHHSSIRVLAFIFWSFGFVSDFGFRILSLTNQGWQFRPFLYSEGVIPVYFLKAL
ncbi:MAG: hypothetical protein QG657_5914 [Acidobacteriota bacterium]|nr:hypothetical protein [Acidobacteriota bacterium]